jgi:hypothetical protein
MPPKLFWSLLLSISELESVSSLISFWAEPGIISAILVFLKRLNVFAGAPTAYPPIANKGLLISFTDI